MKGSLLLLSAALLAAAPSSPLVAQQDTAASPPGATAVPVDRDRLELFVTVSDDIARVANPFTTELARVFESQRRAEIRTELDDSIAAVYERNAMTRQEFERLTFLVSADSAHRAAFDEIRAARDGRGGPPPSR